MEAYFVNPVRKAKRKKVVKEKKKMAKRKQPAALRKYWAARKAKKSAPRKARKASRRRKSSPPKARKVHRRRHVVKSHRRRGGSVGGYRRKGARVKKHFSNPMGLGNLGSTTLDGLIMAGVFFGALFAVGYANGMIRRVPMLSAGWGELAGKLGLALGVVAAGTMATRKGWLSQKNANAVILAGFSPLALGLLGRVAPQVAGQITLAQDDEDMSAELAMTPGNRLSDYTMDAELAAELGAGERESESSSF